MLIVRDDERLTLLPKEMPELRWVRFRTLGCYPLTGAIDCAPTPSPRSSTSLPARAPPSGRAAPSTMATASMERKKVEGYF